MRFYNLVVLLIGILLLVNIAGYQTALTGGALSKLGLVDSTGEASVSLFKSSSLFSSLLSTLGLFALGAGIVLGAFGRAPDIRYGTAAWVSTLTGFLTADIVALFLRVKSYGIDWITNLGVLLFGGMLVVLYVSAISYWQGSDG